MSSVRITAIPPGFAPEDIRRQWVGIMLPLATTEEMDRDPPSGFCSGTDNAGGFVVLRSKAIESLRQAGRNEAADFWDALPGGRYLLFKKELCEVAA